VFSAVGNFKKHNRFFVSPMSKRVQTFFTVIAACGVVFLSTWWGLKYKRIYLDPYSRDPKLSSVFMRMTSSDVKPFDACAFIRANKLKGNMFNYWTEGGFIAWGQEPDPDTGKTPLQLFMDGRAQAAYEPAAYRRWSQIMLSGPIARRALLEKRKPTKTEYAEIGKWLDAELKKHEVWVVLMPFKQFHKNLVMGLEHNADWRIVFMNNKQKLLVNIKTDKGRQLYKGIFDKTTIYPDNFSRMLTLAHNLLRSGDKKQLKIGLAAAQEAFKLNPSTAPVRELLFAAEHGFRGQVEKFCENYFMYFAKNIDTYAKQDGFGRRLRAALFAGSQLAKKHMDAYEKSKSEEELKLVKFYTSKMKEYDRLARYFRYQIW